MDNIAIWIVEEGCTVKFVNRSACVNRRGEFSLLFVLLCCTLHHVPPEAFTPISRRFNAPSFLRYAYPVGGGWLS